MDNNTYGEKEEEEEEEEEREEKEEARRNLCIQCIVSVSAFNAEAAGT